MCALDGTVLGASRAATTLLAAIGGSERIPARLWHELESGPVGEPMIWAPPDRGFIGCTCFPVGADRVLLVMRELSLRHEALALKLQQHRSTYVELLVSLLAHDLRSALLGVMFQFETLRERGEPEVELLDSTVVAVAELRGTLDALVDVVRTVPSRITELPVTAVVDRAVRLTRPLFRQRGHELVISVAPAAAAVRTNGVVVQEILLNLMINAAESSTRPIRVELTAEPTSLGDAPAVRVCVRDRGPGIASADQARLFQPFFTTKPNGTGLGLALAREAAASIAGCLRLVPVADGTCFEVIFPIASTS